MADFLVRAGFNLASLLFALWVIALHRFEISYVYLFWGFPTLLINILEIYLLSKNLLKTPKNIDKRLSTLIIMPIALFALSLNGLFLNYPPVFTQEINQYARFVGYVLNIITFPLVIWALCCLGSCLSVLPEANKIVTKGIYKYIRHPLYFCYIIWAFSNILIFQSLPVILISAIFVSSQIYRMKLEEDILLKSFPEYELYMKQTNRTLFSKL